MKRWINKILHWALQKAHIAAGIVIPDLDIVLEYILINTLDQIHYNFTACQVQCISVLSETINLSSCQHLTASL